MRSHLLATFALILSGVIGGFAAYFSKIILRELPPLTILFLRMSIMLVILLPLTYKYLPHLLKHWKQIFATGIFWIGNLILFIIGIQYTTAIASGIIYAGSPIVVLIEDHLLNQAKVDSRQIIGIFLALFGVVIVVIDSNTSGIGFGSVAGIILLLLAKMSYSTYLVISKRYSQHISPLGLTTGAAICGWVISGIVMGMYEGTSGLVKVPFLSVSAWIALLFIGILLGVVMYFLVQWGIKRASPLVAASMIYVTTFISALSGVWILGEKLTFFLFLGGIFMLSGVYFISIWPILATRRHTKPPFISNL